MITPQGRQKAAAAITHRLPKDQEDRDAIDEGVFDILDALVDAGIDTRTVTVNELRDILADVFPN